MLWGSSVEKRYSHDFTDLLTCPVSPWRFLQRRASVTCCDVKVLVPSCLRSFVLYVWPARLQLLFYVKGLRLRGIQNQFLANYLNSARPSGSLPHRNKYTRILDTFPSLKSTCISQVADGELFTWRDTCLPVPAHLYRLEGATVAQ